MGWKFWQTDRNHDTGSRSNLPKPKEIPEMLGRYLVVQEQMDPDYVWTLKCALKSNSNGKKAFDFRVFNENSARSAGVRVADYDALDDHPELILFHGRIDRATDQMEIRKSD